LEAVVSPGEAFTFVEGYFVGDGKCRFRQRTSLQAIF
jgi:hypothetical protein